MGAVPAEVLVRITGNDFCVFKDCEPIFDI
jgi:hypothetical protein